MEAPRILFAGGGSVGHIAPSVAVWRSIQRSTPNAEALFVCANRSDDIAFLESEKVPLRTMPHFKPSLKEILSLPRTFIAARSIIRDFKPDIVFGKGGSVSLTMCIVATLHRIPTVIHESDVRGGRANAVAGFFAKKICRGFDSRTNSRKIAVTGNPVRPHMTTGKRERGLAMTKFRDAKPVLLVTGGSQGAKALNDFIEKNFDELSATFDILHVCGNRKRGSLEDGPSYKAFEFLTDRLADAYALADVALSRAGGGSISELAACGVPSVLVPLEGVPHAHQEANAVVAEKCGGFIMVRQRDMRQKVPPALLALLEPGRANKARSLYIADAADRIAKIILDLLAKRDTAS